MAILAVLSAVLVMGAIMLVERIDAVAPEMPLEMRRWFLDTDYAMPSVEHQDWDLVLAQWNFVPLLIEYLDEGANPIEKRFEAFSALMVLQGDIASTGDTTRKNTLRQQIERLILQDRNFARRISGEWLGLVEALVVRKILGEDIPRDIPEWVQKEIAERTQS